MDMKTLSPFAARLAAFLARGRRGDAEFSEEIQSHLDLLVDENMRRGMSLADARERGQRLPA